MFIIILDRILKLLLIFIIKLFIVLVYFVFILFFILRISTIMRKLDSSQEFRSFQDKFDLIE